MWIFVVFNCLKHSVMSSLTSRNKKRKLLNGKNGLKNPPVGVVRDWTTKAGKEKWRLDHLLIHHHPQKSNITLFIFFLLLEVRLEKTTKVGRKCFGSCRNLHFSLPGTNERHDVSCKMHERLLWISYAIRSWILIHPSIFFLRRKTKQTIKMFS